MKRLISTYKKHFKEKEYIHSLLFSVLLLIFSGVVSYYATLYATLRESSPVTDIILSNTRAVNVDGLFVYGGIMLFFGILFLCVIKPQRLPFAFKSLALFILIRSIFISLTHLGPFPTHAFVSQNGIAQYFSSDGDLFFSGHTGMPFLIALVFWDNKFLRYIFLFLSVFFGAVVLMGHLHYTIDVVSAFFITYSIYKICTVFFKRDMNMFENLDLDLDAEVKV